MLTPSSRDDGRPSLFCRVGGGRSHITIQSWLRLWWDTGVRQGFTGRGRKVNFEIGPRGSGLSGLGRKIVINSMAWRGGWIGMGIPYRRHTEVG